MSELQSLGYDSSFHAAFLASPVQPDEVPARVVEEHRGGFRIQAATGLHGASVSGRMRHECLAREDLPAVGDWVGATLSATAGPAIIHRVLPRRTAILRRSPDRTRSRGGTGGRTEAQVLAANLDVALVVTSLNRDFNLRRIERLLTLAWESGVEPVVLLSKADLCEDVDTLRREAETVARGVPVIPIAAPHGSGLAELVPYLTPRRTLVVLGSSGVGKSTLINALVGSPVQVTGAIRADDERGRHTTTHRQIFVLPGGALLIDTPGLREIALWQGDDALPEVFDDLDAVARTCRFSDCRHDGEPGCAVDAALASGDLDPERFESWRKLERELEALERRKGGRAASDAKRIWKVRAKALRRHYRDEEA